MKTMTTVGEQIPVTSSKPFANTAPGITELAGRVLLATLFLLSGLGKIGAFTATAGYMTSPTCFPNASTTRRTVSLHVAGCSRRTHRCRG